MKVTQPKNVNETLFKTHYAVVFGNLLEFYEFTLFMTLLPIIAPLFFPAKEVLSSFISGYLFLSIGFLARPFGAIIFGSIGDTQGRKKALLISILLMSLSTLGIGLIPHYDYLGTKILWILAICRICQGLSAGGEYSGAGLMSIEKSNEKDKTFNSAVLTASGLLGSFIGSFFASLISISFLPESYWRYLFIIGGILGLVIFYFRLSIIPNVSKDNMIQKNHISWYNLFKNYKFPLMCAISFGGLMTVPFYLVTAFMNTYFIALGVYQKSTLMFINAFIYLFCAIGVIYFGMLSRKINPIKMMIWSSLGIVLFAFPFFWLVNAKSFVLFMLAEIVLLILQQLFMAPGFAVTAQLFPYQVRYRGVAIGNCIGLAFLGGLTPFISVTLVQATKQYWAPGLYLGAVALLSFICIQCLQKKAKILKSEDLVYNLA